jgi:hypothetical protein
MKKLFVIVLLFVSLSASAQLTLSQKSALAENEVFRSRIYQALFSKANVFINQNPLNLEWQKKVIFARYFSSGYASSVNIKVVSNLWLANYNNVPVLDSNNQPIDQVILDSNALDVVYNLLAGIKPGDDQLPIE